MRTSRTECKVCGKLVENIGQHLVKNHTKCNTCKHWHCRCTKCNICRSKVVNIAAHLVKHHPKCEKCGNRSCRCVRVTYMPEPPKTKPKKGGDVVTIKCPFHSGHQVSRGTITHCTMGCKRLNYSGKPHT